MVAAGRTRLAYSAEDLSTRSVVMGMMKELCMTVRVDAAGNIIGRHSGLETRPAIAMGSHVDTVRNGGRFDGVLGVAAALECVATIRRSGYLTCHPLEVIVFANEEGQNFGALCGSRAMTGALEPDALTSTDGNGRSLVQAIEYVGGAPQRITSAVRHRGEVAWFLELHIEQGGVLEALQTPIGVVEGISGIAYTEVRVLGVANHSGTTMMEHRRDALVAAAELVTTVRDAALAQECRVATVGRLIVGPNTPNVIPGEVSLTLELRDLRKERIEQTLEHLRKCGAAIGNRTGTQVEFIPRDFIEPVLCSAAVQDAIVGSCEELDLPYHRMPSGAGHDSQMMARIAPMGMIFVPSAGGISHSPEEYTSPEQCASGTEVLLRTVLRLDQVGEPRGTE